MAALKYILILSLSVSSVISVSYKFSCDREIDCGVENGTDTPTVIPDPNNCQNFYTCDQANKISNNVSYTCGEGLYFHGEADPAQCMEGSCIYPECSDKVQSVCRTSCGETPPDVDSRIMYPGACNNSYLCTSFGIFDAPCEAGLYYNGVECVADLNAACCNFMCSLPDCTGLDNLIEIPHRTSCTKFYLCFNGSPLAQNCENDGVFDFYTNKCVAADKSTCGILCDEADTKTEDAHVHTYHNPICYNGSDLKCTSDGHFPVCSTCHSNYVKCDKKNNVVSTCKEGEYFPPGIGFTDCLPLKECRKIEDRLFA